MTKYINYKKYLYSLEWLLKKNELISTYRRQGWKINCNYCGDPNNLQVHHNSYKNVGNEILTDGRIWELTFACNDCHKKIHFEKGFKEKAEKKLFEDFIKICKSNKVLL